MNIAHYKVADEIGRGGMGTVFRGINTRTKESVAVKQLKAELTTPDMLERFRREGEALRALNHPNIVKLLDALEHAGQHYLVMEYVDGSDLSTVMKSGQRMPQEQVISLAIDLADALTRAHKLDIIHRDLKPANVLIGADGILRLTDFGVAHVATKERVTETNAIVGTVHYLSPEAINGLSIDSRTDIWAFGIMLCEMLTGTHPFERDTITSTMLAIANEPLPDLEALVPDVPVALLDLIYRMLEKDPVARIPSVRIVGAELEAIAKGRVEIDQNTRRFDTPPPTDELNFNLRHNLPTQTTPFVGREHELAELSRLLNDPNIRLITILAPGGMGKTRLSLAAAERQLDAFADGVFFVELAPTSDLDGIITAIGEAVSFPFGSDGRTPKQQILDFLRHKQLLLVMDNYEHIIDDANLVGEILGTASDVQILATSRQRLNQTGEALFHLSGLDFPDWETPADALNYAAVKLFQNSAKRARPDFEITSDNLDYIARICRKVQGMPLGIVLAASWLGMLSIDEVVSELAQGIDFLETDEGELPERQRSIRAVIDYSWAQMSGAEQTIFMKMSVFRNGFTREAAQTVTGASLRNLMSLINKSLIRRDADTGRYHVHELLRQYAYERLDESGQLDTTKQAHCDYYVTLAEEHSRQLQVDLDNHENNIHTISADYDNIIEAWETAIANKDVALLGRVIMMISYYQSTTLLTQGLNLFLATWNVISDDNKAIKGHLASAITQFAGQVGEYEIALKHLQLATDLEPYMTEPRFIVAFKMTQSMIYTINRDAEGWGRHLEEMLKISREANMFAFELALHGMIGFQRALVLEIEESEAMIDEVWSRLDGKELTSAMAYLYAHKGELLIWREKYAEAREILETTRQISRRIRSGQKDIDTTVLLSTVAYLEGDYDATLDLTQQAIAIGDRLGLHDRALRDAYAMEILANIAFGQAEASQSALIAVLKQIELGDPTLVYSLDMVAVAQWLIVHDNAEDGGMILHNVLEKSWIALAPRKVGMSVYETLPDDIRARFDGQGADWDTAHQAIQQLTDTLT